MLQLGGEGDDEIGTLARAFNQMSAQVSRSNRAMRDLLANVSHELKTPLTSIRGFAKAMVDGLATEPADYKEMAGAVYEEAERIRVLVDDLLYLSEIESGTLQLTLDHVDIDAIVADTARRLRFAAEDRNVTIRQALRPPRGADPGQPHGQRVALLTARQRGADPHVPTGWPGVDRGA